MEDQAMEWENQEYEENSGKMNWIWDKGLAFGKRILVTGFVISSAPVVVPPLVVISALGFACSVPYGIFLASYACTETLMSKLLPSPTTTPFGEYGMEDEEKYEGEDAGFGGNIEEADKELLEGKDEIVEKKGYEEDFNEDVDKEEEELSKESEMKMVGIREKEEQEPVTEKNKDIGEEIGAVMIVIEGEEKSGSNVTEEEAPFEVTGVAVELCQGDTNADNELVSDTNGLVEKIKDEGKADEGVGENKQSAEGVNGGSEEGLKKTDKIVEETVTQTVERNANGHVVIETRTIDRKIKENGDKGKPTEIIEVVKMGAAESAPAVPKETAISSNADARKIADESGLDLTDDKNAAQLQYSADYGTLEGSEQSKNADTLELTLPSKAHEPKNGGTPSESDQGTISNEMGHGEVEMMATRMLYSEEKIWKKLDAMRKIVGYTTARHGTCMEELKALYVFTGVEPPASFKDPSDLVEVNDKLRFLMSIIGVK